MSLIFFDGFDPYNNNTLLLHRWTSQINAGSFAGGRLSGNSYNLNNCTLNKQFAAAQEHATYGAGFGLYMTGNNPIELWFMSDSLATGHVVLYFGTDRTVRVYRGGTGGTLLASVPNVFTFSVWNYYEILTTLHDSTGSVLVKANGQTIINLTNTDTKNGGTKTVFDSISWRNGSNNSAIIDDFYVINGAGATQNTLLGEQRIVVLVPTGAGNTTQLTPSTGSNWAAVDETPVNSTDYVSHATDNNYDTYAMSDLPTPAAGSTYSIAAVAPYFYAWKSDTGTKAVAPVYRSGGTDYEGASQLLNTSAQLYTPEIAVVNPATGVAWTQSEVNAMEFGPKVKAS